MVKEIRGCLFTDLEIEIDFDIIFRHLRLTIGNLNALYSALTHLCVYLYHLIFIFINDNSIIKQFKIKQNFRSQL